MPKKTTRKSRIKPKLTRRKYTRKYSEKAGFGRRYERGTKRQANTIKKRMYENTRKFLGIKTKSERSAEKVRIAEEKVRIALTPGPINSKEEKNIDIYMNRRAGEIKNRDQQIINVANDIQTCKIFMDLIKEDPNIIIENAILQFENADPSETTLEDFAEEKSRTAEGYIRQFKPFYDWAVRRYNNKDTDIFENWLTKNI